MHRRCPEGFRLGCLEIHHAQEILKHFTNFIVRPREVLQSFFEGIITRLETSAVFTSKDPNTPISYTFEHPEGHIGFVYTHEEYRRLQLSALVRMQMGLKMVARGDIPQTCAHTDNTAGITWMTEKLGMQRLETRDTLIIGE